MILVEPDYEIPKEYIRSASEKRCKRHTHRSRSKFSPPNLCVPKCPKHYRYDYKLKQCVLKGSSRPKVVQAWSILEDGTQRYKLPPGQTRCSPGSHKTKLYPGYCVKGSRSKKPRKSKYRRDSLNKEFYKKYKNRSCRDGFIASPDGKYCIEI